MTDPTPFYLSACPHIRYYVDRNEWLADRSAKAPDGHPSIGASDVGAIFGCGFRSPVETALLMRGIAERSPEPTDPMNPMNVGSRLESTALAEYELLTEQPGCVDGEITRWTHPVDPWLSVSPDALVYDHSGLDADLIGIVECKIPRGGWALEAYAPELPIGEGYGIAATLADRAGPVVPRGYALQAFTQLGVMRDCGAPVSWCDVWVWPSPHEHRRVRLLWDADADAAWIDLRAAIAEWRRSFVIEGQDHPITCPDDAAVAIRYWGREGQHEAPGLARAAKMYADLGARIKALQAEQDAAKAVLIEAVRAAGADRILIPDPAANPLAAKKAEREGKPGKITISRGLRVTPGWLAEADPSDLIDDPGAAPQPIIVPGVTIAELRDDATEAAADPTAAAPALPTGLAAALAAGGDDW